jgi:proteasome maturation protein
MPSLPQSNLHLDILMGRDETIEPADIFGGEPGISAANRTFVHTASIGMETMPPQDIHKDMELKLKL